MADRPVENRAQTVFARTPVCDATFNVIAYELVVDGTSRYQPALPEIISGILTDGRIYHLLNNRPVLLLADVDTLQHLYTDLRFPMDRFWLMLDTRQVIRADAHLINGLKKRGARFGLSVNQGDLPDLPEALAGHISFVRATSRQFLQRHLDLQLPSEWYCIASDVDDEACFQQLQERGISRIQGRYLPRPEPDEISQIPSNKLIALEILNLLGDINVSLEELENLIVQDLQLYYKLLRFINSAYYNFNRKINSIKEALIYLGLNTLRSISLVIALSESTTRSPDLFYLALTRAKMCELLAQSQKWPNEAIYFNAGLVSLLDVLLEIPMDMILSELPLSASIKEAVLHYEGRVGSALRCAIHYEHVDWKEIADSQFDKDLAHTAYLEASRWATALQQGLSTAVES